MYALTYLVPLAEPESSLGGNKSRSCLLNFLTIDTGYTAVEKENIWDGKFPKAKSIRVGIPSIGMLYENPKDKKDLANLNCTFCTKAQFDFRGAADLRRVNCFIMEQQRGSKAARLNLVEARSRFQQNFQRISATERSIYFPLGIFTLSCAILEAT